MNTRRDFLKLGALWVPALAAPTVAYSFLRPPMPFFRIHRLYPQIEWSFDGKHYAIDNLGAYEHSPDDWASTARLLAGRYGAKVE